MNGGEQDTLESELKSQDAMRTIIQERRASPGPKRKIPRIIDVIFM